MWIRKLKKADLKLLCKATKMTVSGTNSKLVQKLEADSFINQLGVSKVAQLCEKCYTEAHLVKRGYRHALVLRLIDNHFGTRVESSFDDTHDVVAVDDTHDVAAAPLPPTMELNHQATTSDTQRETFEEFIKFQQ